MNVIDAMKTVMDHVREDRLEEAQRFVIEIEANGGSALPSSMFEMVLVASLKAWRLTPEYQQFCITAYGLEQYTRIVRATARSRREVG